MLGFFALDSTLTAAIAIVDGSGVPLDPTNAPTYRIYDGESLIANGTLSKIDSGVITDATNATPIVITDTAHGLASGNLVTVSNVLGNTAANGTFVITYASVDTFSLNTSVGNGAYTSGGVWHVTGLYGISLAVLSASGFEAGKIYQMLVNYSGASNFALQESFGVS